MPLLPGESFTHRNRVYHLRGDRQALNRISQKFLRTSFEEAADLLWGSAKEVEPAMPMLS